MKTSARGLASIPAFLLILMLLLAACGDAATATTAPVATAPTVTTGGATTASTATTAVAAGGVVEPGATPVSDWSPGAYANSVPAPAKLVTAGTFTVGSDTTYPPQEYIDATGKAVGLDIDIATEIGTRLGLTPKIVTFKFDDILPGLLAGQFDVVVSAMTITDERSQVVDFVPYFEAGQAVLVKSGNPKGIKALEDLSGLTVAVQSGTIEQDTMTDLNAQLKAAGKAEANVLTYTADTDTVDQLRVGRADATLHDSPVAAYYAAISGGQFEVAVPNFDSAPEGIAIAKNNPDMRTAIEAAVTAMKSDGTLDKIKAKWGVK